MRQFARAIGDKGAGSNLAAGSALPCIEGSARHTSELLYLLGGHTVAPTILSDSDAARSASPHRNSKAHVITQQRNTCQVEF